MPRPQLALLALTLFAAPDAAAQTLRLLAADSYFSTNGPAHLVELDPATTTGTTLGTITTGVVDALAWSPLDGRIYASINTTRELVTVDAFTGTVVTVVGSLGNDRLEGLTVHPVTGELYGIAFPSSRLVRVDPATAQVTDVGASPTSVGSGLAFSPDGTTLYWVDWADGSLWSIDTATVTPTFLTHLNAGATGGPLGLTVHPMTGDLYVAEWRDGNDATILRVTPGTWTQTTVGTFVGFSSLECLTFVGDVAVGLNYCKPAADNSTGRPAEIRGTGTPIVAFNDLVLQSSSLPSGTFAFFLASRNQDMVPNAGGSEGTLCLGHPIGRLIGPGQIVQSNAAGEISVPIDLTTMPQPTGSVSVTAGETWNFQGWYRDAIGGAPTSNFTDGLSVLFL